MTDLEKKIMFELIDKFTCYEPDDSYKAMDLERLILEYAKSRNIDLDYVEIY